MTIYLYKLLDKPDYAGSHKREFYLMTETFQPQIGKLKVGEYASKNEAADYLWRQGTYEDSYRDAELNGQVCVVFSSPLKIYLIADSVLRQDYMVTREVADNRRAVLECDTELEAVLYLAKMGKVEPMPLIPGVYRVHLMAPLNVTMGRLLFHYQSTLQQPESHTRTALLMFIKNALNLDDETLRFVLERAVFVE